MSDPLDALHLAIGPLLRDDAGLAAAMGGTVRAYDRVPNSATFPYVTVDLGQAVEDDDDCARRWDVFASFHVWSRDTGRRQAFAIAAALRQALDVKIALQGVRTVQVQYLQTRMMTDPDGLTTHGVVEMRWRIAA